MEGKCKRARQEIKRYARQAIAQSGSASRPEALSVAARVHNRSPIFRDKISPYQLVFGQISHDDWGNVNGLRHEEGFQKLCKDDHSGFLLDLKTNIDSTLTIYRDSRSGRTTSTTDSVKMSNKARITRRWRQDFNNLRIHI
ncbi:hypothetical protein Pmar_PMAR002484 [Perkinsus marinus ATCC 50983]|uniref:Uncharacterized protein n=1 Tax=Perkinsus marinus (strain ATCC 50983 / TXsc) TaxID=423536 RepID=C5KS95_PERM5|nr:hypothetical protein Pmar_PMAR002484 [Perkinsus marinus ATCC 50983]EER12676.1 hypothetical protein Pmar_PMAR002484 [Perkinsus marinus ATCC 50983]|eukprot:XP_002780881.1 hypothetical protein Pmar_PMAR002484 [Perkinsus marinus ATCC 50983]